MKRRLAIGAMASLAAIVALAVPAAAQDDVAFAPQFLLDNMWVMLAGVLVFLMQAGFGLVEAGLTRAKNVANIMAKNLADATLGILMFFIFGYAFAFGGGNDFIGTDSWLLFMDLDTFTDMSEGLSHSTSFFFQAMFAATAVTIASGAMAGRTNFVAYLIFGAITTAFIYPVVVHWTWGGGLIANISIGDAVYSDFAGSTIVHSVGAWAALMGAIILGPRIGKYDEDGKPRAIPGHSMPFAIIGVFILWFGWFGFNGGSELAADNLVAFVNVNTALAACAGVIGATIVIWAKTGKADVAMMGNGALAGLVSITAPVGAVTPFIALIIGLIGGVLVVFSVLGIDRMGIDDPVGAISVHGVCGVWGTLSIGLFARYDDAFLGREDAGLFYGGGINQLIVQLIMVLIVAAWTLGTTGIVFMVLKNTVGLRVDRETEIAGLDIEEHGSAGYTSEMISV